MLLLAGRLYSRYCMPFIGSSHPLYLSWRCSHLDSAVVHTIVATALRFSRYWIPHDSSKTEVYVLNWSFTHPASSPRYCTGAQRLLSGTTSFRTPLLIRKSSFHTSLPSLETVGLLSLDMWDFSRRLALSADDAVTVNAFFSAECSLWEREMVSDQRQLALMALWFQAEYAQG